MEDAVTLSISFRGTIHSITLPKSSSVESLQEEIEKLISVPPSLQKLLYKGKKTSNPDESLDSAGFKDGMKLQVLGSLPSELDGMQKAEAEKKRKDEIMKARESKPSPKVGI